MTVPLLLLAALTCAAGFIPFPRFVAPDNIPYATHVNLWIAAASVAVGALGIWAAVRLYKRESDRPERLAARWACFWRAAANRFYIDRAWDYATKNIIFRFVSTPVAWFDRKAIDGGMDAIGAGTEKVSGAIKGSQSGKVQTYAVVFVASVLAITVVVFLI
jgi:NADH-quinone oxidoreductase subunit L